MELRGTGVILREHRPEDLHAVHRWHGDPEVMFFLSWGADTLEESYLYLAECIRDQRQTRRDRYRLAIEDIESSQVMGCATIHWRGRGSNGGDGRLGCFLARDFQGRGVATEATKLLIRFGFQQLGMHRISATCLAANKASEKALRKMGFVYEGTMRSHSCRDGVWFDRHFFSILSDEWSPS
ncbi:MAG TPA: GNAT family protein [Candidatus Sabulitectum sp.]|nr:GNAT family protein [Candidatus Sabulitectum sp.]